MKSAILGKKIGMSQIFNNDGKVIPVTVVEAGPCYVSQIKTDAVDGYNAVQISFMDTKESNKAIRLTWFFMSINHNAISISPKESNKKNMVWGFYCSILISDFSHCLSCG